MTSARRGRFAASLGLALTACSQLAPGPPGAGHPAVLAREDFSPGFISFIGPKARHAPLFLDTPGTNFYCLRSFLDRRTGETTHQLYVSDSYLGTERDWNAARDSTGTPLPFVAVSREEIACEEFAVTLPESELRANPDGLAVTFAARSGDEKTIRIPGEWIAVQLAAIGAKRNPAQPIAAFRTTPQ